MKKIKLLTIILICAVSLNAQEISYIFLNNGDTIKCKNIVRSDNPLTLNYFTFDGVICKIKYPKYVNYINFPNIEINIEKDDFTKCSKKSTNLNSVGINENTENITFIIQKIEKSDTSIYGLFVWSATNPNLGCCGNNKNYIIFILDNNEVIKIENDIADIKCSDYANISIFEITSNNMNIFKNKILKVRFQQSEYYSDYNILYPDYFINCFNELNK